jgi:hypothetical protein
MKIRFVSLVLVGEFTANEYSGSFEVDISGDIPVNSSKSDKIQRFGAYKRKNSPYF